MQAGTGSSLEGSGADTCNISALRLQGLSGNTGADFGLEVKQVTTGGSRHTDRGRYLLAMTAVAFLRAIGDLVAALEW